MSSTQVQTVTQEISEPLLKKQRLKAPKKPVESNSRRQSRIFSPFRTLGLVSPTSIPFTAVSLGSSTFQITTSTGRSLHTYDLRKGLNLIFITKPSTPEFITATVAWKDVVLAAWGREAAKAQGVWIFKRGRKIGELQPPLHWGERILSLHIFGSWIIGCSPNRLHVWKSATSEYYTTLISDEISRNSSTIQYTGCACTLQTYVNKLFVGRQDGSVELWNVSTGKLLYTIYAPSSQHGAVTAMEPTTSLSLLAIGYGSGRVVIHDIRKDQKILTLNKTSYYKGAVTSISFRSDGLGAGKDGREAGVVATSFEDSDDIIFWDLNDGARKMGVLRNAHRTSHSQRQHHGESKGVNKVEFLAGQAILVTTGSDNSLKTWVFDESPFSPIPRILHTRGGHAAPVSALHFLPPDADGADINGKWLMSGSLDQSFWAWSLRRDGQSTELSQGNVQKKVKKLGLAGSADSESGNVYGSLKAPPVTCIACSLNRDGGMGAMPGKQEIWGNLKGKRGGTSGETSLTGWESVVTGHKGDKYARTWFWGRKRAGRWAFKTSDDSPVTSVTITQCGTFALIGSSTGSIDMYNLQSGYHRQQYPTKSKTAQSRMQGLKNGEKRTSNHHTGDRGSFSAKGQAEQHGAIVGLAVDSLNRTVICCTRPGVIRFYKFATGLLDAEIDWRNSLKINGLRYHRFNDLIALACDDFCIRVVDIETRKLIRELHGCNEAILDWCFSNDGRWIIASSADSVVRTWDLPTGHLIDAVRFRHQCTSLAFSNTGDFLATAHENSKGIHLWSNRSLFTHVSTRRLAENDIAEIDAPTPSGENRQSLIDFAEDNQANINEDDFTASTSIAPTIDQLSSDLQTLSVVPKTRWQTLLHLDVIKQRNKPIEPPKQPEKAPFFLPSLQPNQTPGTDSSSGSKLITTKALSNPSSTPLPNANYLNQGGSLTEQTQSISTILNSMANTSNNPHQPLINYLKTLSPSSADLAIRSINPHPPYDEMVTFVDALVESLRSRRNYELVQAWMAVFLRHHSDVINADEKLMNAVRRWRDEEVNERARLNELVGFCAGVLGFIREARA